MKTRTSLSQLASVGLLCLHTIACDQGVAPLPMHEEDAAPTMHEAGDRKTAEQAFTMYKQDTIAHLSIDLKLGEDPAGIIYDYADPEAQVNALVQQVEIEAGLVQENEIDVEKARECIDEVFTLAEVNAVITRMAIERLIVTARKLMSTDPSSSEIFDKTIGCMTRLADKHPKFIFFLVESILDDYDITYRICASPKALRDLLIKHADEELVGHLGKLLGSTRNRQEGYRLCAGSLFKIAKAKPLFTENIREIFMQAPVSNNEYIRFVARAYLRDLAPQNSPSVE